MEKVDLEFLKQHKPTVIGLPEAKKAAVCIPLIGTEDGWDLLFEVRSAAIKSQPGDICFPGGAVKDGETTQEAAVREMTEELLIGREQIEVLGLTDVFVGRAMNIYPYAVRLLDYAGTFSPDEVDRVFRVPLAWFAEHDPEVYQISLQVMPGEEFPYERIYGGRNYRFRDRSEEVLFYQYETDTIWGMTAAIVHAFAGLFGTT